MIGELDMANKNTPDKENLNLAGRYYEVEDYSKNDELSSGLATTHEQVSDTYMEGEIMPVIENVNGKDLNIPENGYKTE